MYVYFLFYLLIVYLLVILIFNFVAFFFYFNIDFYLIIFVDLQQKLAMHLDIYLLNVINLLMHFGMDRINFNLIIFQVII